MKRTRVSALAAAAVLVTSWPAGVAFGMDKTMETVMLPAPAVSEPAMRPVELAKVEVEKETAIALARKHFEIPAELGEPNAQLFVSSHQHASPSWHLSWTPQENMGDMRTYRVTVNATTGRITDYSYSGNPPESLALQYTREEALAEAKAWLMKLVPDIAHELELDNNPLTPLYFYGGGNATHGFYWKRMNQGAQVGGQGVNISIDALTGELVGFSVSLNKEVTFSGSTERLPMDEATATFADELVMELGYKYFHIPGTNEGEWRLVYQLKGAPTMDAATGELYYNGKPYDRSSFAPKDSISTGEQAAPQVTFPWTQEEAIAVAHQVTGISRETSPTSVYFSEGKNPKPYMNYSISWELPGDKGDMWGRGYRYHSVSIDAMNNVVTNYHSYSYEEPEQLAGQEPMLDEQGAREAILKFLQTHRSDLTGNLREEVNTYPWGRYPWEPETEEQQSLRTSYEMSFRMLHEGLPVYDTSINVSVHLYTGQITYFSAYGHDLITPEKPLPKASGMLNADQAVAALLEQYPLVAVWSNPPATDTKMIMPIPQAPVSQQPLQLYYQLGNLYSHMLDAFSGHALDYNGRDLVLAATRPLDIQGHWAEREIELLLARGVFDPTGESFNPGGQVTQGDAVRWLVLSRGLQPFYRASYDFALAGNAATKEAAPYAQAAVTAGILNPIEFGGAFDAEGAMSREEFALWAIRAMGYEKVAAMSATIEIHFSDAAEIGAKFRNAVALLAGLDIVSSGDDVPFRAQATLTRAEAAKVLYGVMANSRGTYPVYYYK